ncbi:hypothetical protein C7271_23205 [filamentous cyanobacterium CCP5]|nr:hypothetical protein C7271_23205 [filamentous cyanobacterium CCP5]
MDGMMAIAYGVPTFYAKNCEFASRGFSPDAIMVVAINTEFSGFWDTPFIRFSRAIEANKR